MILRACLSILVLVHLSAAECDCTRNQTDYQTVYTAAGPRDPQSYAPCYPALGYCSYIAATNNESLSLCNINFISFTSLTDSPPQIVIMDGLKVAFNLTPTDVQDPTMRKNLASFISETSELDIFMIFANNTSGSISLYFYSCLKPSPPPATTPAPTFPTISGAPSQPGLLGADIAFAFVSAGCDDTMFNQTAEAISATVQNLNIVQSKDNPMGVRLGFLAPSGGNQPNTYGDQWNLDLNMFETFLDVAPRVTGFDKAQWLPGLEAFLNESGYFDSKYSRANVQKIFAFFTQTSPSEDATALKQSLLKLKKLDVHMVVVDVRPSPDPVFIELQNDSEISNFAYMNLTYATDFLYNYVLQSDIDPTYGCTYGDKEQIREIPIGGNLTLSWPLNFGDDHAQYCNNQQNSELTLENKNDSTKSNLCVFIPFYELETEKDYLRFFDADGKEIASFTGYDVVGSKFLIPGNKTRVTFTTNENLIYKGVQFIVTAADRKDCS